MQNKTKYFKVLRCFCLFLSLLTVFCAVGCDGGNDPEGTSGSLTTEKSGTTPPADTTDDLVIASDGKTDLTIWVERDLYRDTTLKNKLDDIVSSIKKKTGATLKIKTDSTATGSDKENPAILVGATSFEESKSVSTHGRKKDFAVTRVGNKILLYATSAEGALNAATNFYNKVVIAQKVENKTLYFTKNHEYVSTYTYPLQSVLCGGTELIDFKIVIPKNADTNETYLANNLRYYLNENYGYKFEIVTDDKAASDHEVLIGKTKRTTVQVSEDQYTVAVSDGKVQMIADGMMGYESLWSYLQTTFMAAGQGKTHTYDAGFSYTANATAELSDGTLFATQKNGDVRVIFYNVYGYSEAGGPTVRQPLQKELIEAYMPDVLGLQEYAAAYHTGFTPMLKALGYTEISTTAGKKNYTPIFYKSDKLEVVTSGYTVYDCPNTVDESKGVTWAVFRVKESGKLFAVFNTHFMYNRDDNKDGKGEDYTATRVSNANEIIEIIQSVQSQYEGISVVMGGDLNSAANSDPHKVLTGGGLVSAWEKAGVSQRNNTSGYNGHATYDTSWKTFSVSAFTGNRSKAIDHAYVSSNTTVKGYASLCNLYAQWTSDHMPILVDLELK